MKMMYHLAQINIARMLAPIDDPLMAEFVARLDTINALADRSPGFIWRLQTESGDATGVRAYDDERIIVNMSVWESLEALTAFVYASDHRPVMQRRRQWFERFDGPYMALWWVPEGDIPSVEDAMERLEHLRANGPTPYAFTFVRAFPAPGSSSIALPEDIEATCGA
jgi:heme-degrading monooxygenase HmoA